MNGINFGYIFHVIMKCPILSVALLCFLGMDYYGLFEKDYKSSATPGSDLQYAVAIKQLKSCESVNEKRGLCSNGLVECTERLVDGIIIHTASGCKTSASWLRKQDLAQATLKSAKHFIQYAEDGYSETVSWFHKQAFTQEVFRYSRLLETKIDEAIKKLLRPDDEKKDQKSKVAEEDVIMVEVYIEEDRGTANAQPAKEDPLLMSRGQEARE